MQVDALTMQVDAFTMQVDALTMQVDAFTMQVDALQMLTLFLSLTASVLRGKRQLQWRNHSLEAIAS